MCRRLFKTSSQPLLEQHARLASTHVLSGPRSEHRAGRLVLDGRPSRVRPSVPWCIFRERESFSFFFSILFLSSTVCGRRALCGRRCGFAACVCNEYCNGQFRNYRFWLLVVLEIMVCSWVESSSFHGYSKLFLKKS